ncbi:GPI-anchor transamidase [Wickerhamiella sorbophila]|uniref:GPI-anchor transamidase n=1 Tax=Wickerhamiella sorbophila TaxID=45607 RepID=A0A2T0FCE8_9ASCO|nr:GPI-anchor transamidase [Wickerhamiella sorbophila]PRT52678.1 GPI-anchor transamidase [Wickerhamiella sorbophila]
MRVGYLVGVVAAVCGALAQQEEGVNNGTVAETVAEERPPLRVSKHTNNWAVLVSTSRFWFNYRHMANVLSFYRTVKRLGIPDDQVIVMLSDDVACNARNPFPGAVYNVHDHKLDLYGENIEVDYRGYEVTVENFIRLLTDRWDSDMPRSKRLNTDASSNILVYLTGHGGNDFLKFQDAEEIGAWDIADAFGQMWEKRRYNEVLFMIDTCEANTMYSKFFAPNVIAVGSSQLDESSYADDTDPDVGVSLIDKFTSINLGYLEQVNKTSQLTLADLFGYYDPVEIASHPGIRDDLFQDDLASVRITDFFGNIQDVEVDAAPKENEQLLDRLSSAEASEQASGHAPVASPVAQPKPISKTAQKQKQPNTAVPALTVIGSIIALVAISAKL